MNYLSYTEEEYQRIVKADHERELKEIYQSGYQLGRFLAVYSFVQDGELSVERASKILKMSVTEFLEKAKQYQNVSISAYFPPK